VRAFVTGASGFVGPWLCQHLEASGDDVVVAGHDVDVTDADGIGRSLTAARPDAIYHLAAQSSVGSSWDDTTGTFQVNLLGTLHVLEAANTCTPRPRVLLVSSAEVYGAVTPADLPVSEDAPFRPVTPYAASKAAAELAGLQAYLGRGLEVVRARPFNHTGPGQGTGFVVPALARQVAEAALSDPKGATGATGATGGQDTKILHTGNLTARRDFTDVRDVVRAYRLLIERGAAGEVYNVCSGRSVLLEDLAKRLLAQAGLDLTIEVAPDRLRPVDVPDMRGDPGRLKEATGWQPTIDLDQTLGDVLAYWRDEAISGAGRS
jgi:GDP-4-dehydro-6-deoxy-D-mannose reductase